MEQIRETKKRAARVRDSQINVLVNYMIDHRDFACGRFQGPQGKATAERQWCELAELVGGHGPQKSVDQWKKVWKDLKRKTRAKNAQMNAERVRTGNASVSNRNNTLWKMASCLE
ncbi:uncharacterized protein LOC124172331 [Ischnura elegans]|uniref:uncharacterized protein LOC124172331 n=1 Tax=Ischnura elegans TaxID=197161 RepID=UPI001ED87F56|nr:uncharacterized protein LOC124155793 isoform X3 [Ischnura elegans]XP_046407732.1 uncharacterized protein LOC124172331 [Ischnura elegans]